MPSAQLVRRVLLKQELLGIQNGFMVTRKDLETIRWQLALADTILRMAADVLESDRVQKIKISVMQECV